MKKLLATSFIVVVIFSSVVSAFSEIITLATMNWQPFYGEDMPENGYFAVLTREALKRADYELTIKFVPWKRALEFAKRGNYDGLLGAYYGEERAQMFYFTDSVAKSDEVFVQKKGRGITYTSLEDLKKYRIGVLRGGEQTNYLSNNGLTVEETTDYIQNLKKLNAGRIDLAAVSRQYFNYILAYDNDFKELQESFEVLEPPFKSYDIFCPITRKRADGETIVKKFNKALREMKSDGTYDAILKRFGQK